MKKYRIAIEETLRKVVEIEAETPGLAVCRAEDEYNEEKHVLSADNFAGADIALSTDDSTVMETLEDVDFIGYVQRRFEECRESISVEDKVRLAFGSFDNALYEFGEYRKEAARNRPQVYRKYSINSLVYWVTYVHNVVYSFYRSMIYCYINSTQRCAGSIVIDIIPTNGADKRKFFPFAPYFPVTNVIKRYFYPYFPAIIGIKGYSFPYFPYLSGIMKIKTALYSLFSRLDWHKTVVFPCLGEIYEGIRSLSWEIPVT